MDLERSSSATLNAAHQCFFPPGEVKFIKRSFSLLRTQLDICRVGVYEYSVYEKGFKK